VLAWQVEALSQLLGGPAPPECVREPAAQAVLEGDFVLAAPASVAAARALLEREGAATAAILLGCPNGGDLDGDGVAAGACESGRTTTAGNHDHLKLAGEREAEDAEDGEWLNFGAAAAIGVCAGSDNARVSPSKGGPSAAGGLPSGAVLLTIRREVGVRAPAWGSRPRACVFSGAAMSHLHELPHSCLAVLSKFDIPLH
jgi:hypothetical protein